ncbi:MAG: hypothetical protein FJZ96_03790 [Chloroflexi bacterium]|nr:hypothetical protein [Chloroflexota bacterium]
MHVTHQHGTNEFDPERHRRRSIRLRGYDYSAAGGYFVTVVAFRRECLFGEIVDGEMRLNALGRIVREEWFRSAQIRKEIRVEEDEFIVMPNHIHGIIWICDVGADGVRPDSGKQIIKPTGFNTRGASLAPLQRPPKSLGSFIAGFKASVTSRAGRELNTANIWQRNYYEHIIRVQKDYERIA